MLPSLPARILCPLTIPKENSSQGPFIVPRLPHDQDPSGQGSLSSRQIGSADTGHRGFFALWPQMSFFSFPIKDQSKIFKSAKCLVSFKLFLKMHFFTSQQWRLLPRPYNFLLITRSQERRRKSPSRESNIIYDLITSCSSISRVPLFFTYFPSCWLFYYRFFWPFSETSLVPLGLSALLPYVKENFSVRIGKKITTTTCPNAYHCRRQHFCVTIQATSVLRFDLESFVKAGPSWRRRERIGCLCGWSGVWGNRWHHGFTWQVYEAAQFSSLEQWALVACIISARTFNAGESWDRDTWKW